MLVVNLFGGAGCGKSTLAAEIFSLLKKEGYRTELVGEYAKECVYQKAYPVMKDQLWLFSNQAHRLRSLSSYGVQVAVCDSPLLLSVAYGNESKEFTDMVLKEHHKYRNLNYVLNRDPSFWKADGRTGDIEQAKSIDEVVKVVLSRSDFSKTILPDNAGKVVEDVERILG